MLDARRRSQSKSYRTSGVWAAVVALLFIGFGTYQVYGYHFGTPTTATVVGCGAGSQASCRGTWTLDGERHTGRIWGDVNGRAEGSSLDVRVLNGWAFARGITKWPFMWGAIFAVGAVLLFVPERRRRRRVDR